MASRNISQPINLENYNIETPEGISNIRIIKFGKIATFKFFTDKNIPNNTILATLPTNLRPYNDWIYPQMIFADPVAILTDSDHKIQIDMTTGEVKYINSNDTSTWNVFYTTYITQ